MKIEINDPMRLPVRVILIEHDVETGALRTEGVHDWLALINGVITDRMECYENDPRLSDLIDAEVVKVARAEAEERHLRRIAANN
jgi:hypothetical protein